MQSFMLKKWIKKLYLPVGIPIGLILGVLVGYYYPHFAILLKWLGDLFLKSLKMIIMPLVMLSIINSVGRIGNLQKFGKKGFYTFVYYISTTAIAVLLGIFLTLLVGFGDIKPTLNSYQSEVVKLNITDIFLNMIPSNIFESMAKNDVLPIIVFSLLLGGTIALEGKSSEPVFRIFFILESAIIKIVHLILWLAPLGIFGLISGRMAENGDKFFQELYLLQYYARNVIFGLMIHGFIILPLLYFIFLRKNPFSYIKKLGVALWTAFSTASSSATLPLTIDCVENKANIRSETAGFVLPLGATVNMDGTALYESVAAIFIAYIANVPLDFYSIVLIFLTSTLAAIGAAGIPEAGLVTMTIVLNSVGLPLEGIALILSIDWFLDRCRTTINVLGDAIGAAIIDKIT